MSVNKVILIGRLGADPEIRYTPQGTAVANFNVATNEVWTDKNGEKQERTEWHRIVVWDKLAETCSQYLNKGKQIFVEGRIQTRQWEDKEGVKRYTTEIIASIVRFLGSKNDQPVREEVGVTPSIPEASTSETQQADADIPF